VEQALPLGKSQGFVGETDFSPRDSLGDPQVSGRFRSASAVDKTLGVFLGFGDRLGDAARPARGSPGDF